MDKSTAEVRKDIDKCDALIAGIVGVFVGLWALIWAYPCPHPEVWPFLAALGGRFSIAVLGAMGKLSAAIFVASVYLIIRIVWSHHRPLEYEFADKFFFSRACAVCGALALVFMPPVWRIMQHLSAQSLLILVEITAVMLWLLAHGASHLLLYALSYLLMGLAGSVNPLALALLACVFGLDSICSWLVGMSHDQREVDEVISHEATIKLLTSMFSALSGIALGIYAFGFVLVRDGAASDLPVVLGRWFASWTAAFNAYVFSPLVLTVAVFSVVVYFSMALGQRIRMADRSGFGVATGLFGVLAAGTLFLAVRSCEVDVRRRLEIIGDFANMVVSDAGSARWLFTDGRFDDLLRHEFIRANRSVWLMDVNHQPDASASARAEKMAPEPGDRNLFAAGGAEVFRAWARERPDRIRESAWFIGNGLLRKFGKAEPCTCGTLCKARADGAAVEECRKADALQDEFLSKVLRVATVRTLWRRIFGDVDAKVSVKFNDVMWRIGRQAEARAEAAAAVGDRVKSGTLKDAVTRLNASNDALRAEGEAIERMLPTANLVPTSREALEIALKRADFTLAERYAKEVLVNAPDDSRANFAMGMVRLERKEYFAAVKFLEKVLKTHPKEPATLNNLALACLKLGKVSEAKAYAERALSVHPQSAEIRRNLAEIEKALGKKSE